MMHGPSRIWRPLHPNINHHERLSITHCVQDRQKALDPFHTTQNAGDVAAASQASASTAAAATSVLTFLAKNLQVHMMVLGVTAILLYGLVRWYWQLAGSPFVQ